jgi:RNA polymerase sigma-70 factor (ECF subfamily)
METPAQIFDGHRPRLFGIAYRMLGSRADAEDILQEAYIRWIESSAVEPRSTQAWLTTIVTRLCIDRLRSAKTERAAYAGSWLPEPLVSSIPDSPEKTAELADDISMAFLTVLERLAPDERAAFLLREVFDFDYEELSRILGKNSAACRQIVHRAKQRVQQERPRTHVSREAHRRLLEQFVAAAHAADRNAIVQLFAQQIRVTSDGGGKVPSFQRIVAGAGRVARLFTARSLSLGGRMVYRFAQVNGEPGLLRYIDGQLESAISFAFDGQQISEIYVVRNPDKLIYVPQTP